MADFQYPDLLGSYVRGRLAPGDIQSQQYGLQAQQQALEEGGLKIDQLRMLLGNQQMYQDVARQALQGQGYLGGPKNGSQAAGAQSPSAPTGGIQNGPQGSVGAETSPQSGGVLGFTPSTLGALALLRGDDPLKTATETQAYQQKQGQLAWSNDNSIQGEPFLRQMATSPDAPAILQRNPSLMQMWPSLAFSNGIDARDMSPHNVNKVAAALYNQRALGLGLPPISAPTASRIIRGPNGQILSQNLDNPGDIKQEVGEESLHPVLVNGQATLLPASQAAGKTPYNQFNANEQQLEGPNGELLAALTSKGVSIPGGRGGQQLVATLNGLRNANPGKTMPEIAEMVRTGQLDFNGAKRSTGQLSTLAAAADVQSRKIEKDLASLGPIIDRLPGGPAKIANVLTNLQKDWSWNGDKDSTEAVGYIKELAGEYAKLVSGSTGMAAPAEGEMKSALGLMQSALTQNGYQGMREFLLTTSQNRRDSVREGLESAAQTGHSVGQGATGKTVTQAQVQDYAAKHGLSVQAAIAHVKANGFTIQ